MKTKLEKHSFYKDVETVWKKGDPDYVASYLRGAANVKRNDNIFEDLIFLSINKKMQVQQYEV